MTMFLYRVLYLPAFLVLLPFFLLKMWRRGGYRLGLANRFGRMGAFPQKRPGVNRIWIQAVSVGELIAIEPLVRAIEQEADLEVILTTTTSTGFAVLKEKFTEKTVWHGIFPLDFWPLSHWAWNQLQPDLAILMEGDLWPEHIHQGYRRGVSVLLVNARVSDKSYRRHLRYKALTRCYFQKLDKILTGSETDLARFRNLAWIPVERIQLAGNLKLDLKSPEPLQEGERSTLLREMGFLEEGQTAADILVILGSSTWPGEEAALVEAYVSIRESFPQVRLLLVPRHAERRKEIALGLKAYPVRLHFRSEGKQAASETEVYIADTTGELKMLTRSTDVVFVGKSLPPNKGGQTPIEAAALGKPLIFGPDMSNFRDVARGLLRDRAALRINAREELRAAIVALLEAPESRLNMGRRAGDYIAVNRGTTERIGKEIKIALRSPV